ncbi:HipA domain-containing protein [Sulfurimonas sp. SAG-AH-194-C20]|nr:HipA domain-containing protein [Sulfurimonas sp. SAG-AH-194-C20]MDF1878395.1 HipA domain-containing protein [Sulfurimonas sp. SAG-AH-194-C20]
MSFIDANAIGALSYEPTEPLPCLDRYLDLDMLCDESQKVLKGDEAIVDELLALNGSSAGARPKAMIQLHKNKKDIIYGQTALTKEYEHWIVKFSASNDMQESAKVEYIYSLIAKECGIEIPDTTLLYTQKSSYFAIKRFDRVGDRRVHIHSLAGLIHSDFRFPTLDYDDLLTLTLHLTKDINELIKVFRLSCFNLFVHNRDDHAKNFSFLLDENYKWKAAPAYDITYSFGPGGEHSMMYLGEGKNPTKEHLQKLVQKHQIKDGDAIITEIAHEVKNFAKYAEQFRLSSDTKQQILNHIGKTI